ncbi:MAG TPA: hypothetical protein PLI74_01825 [Candidatus Kapabacteria bacterium]|nr:hypothetical protein [Candidatus Kapabacteria bacterium]
MNTFFSFVILGLVLFGLSLQSDAHEDSKCGTFASPNKDISVLNNPRPLAQRSISSPSGKFLIHYDIEGIHAVDVKDVDGNTVPDWIDSVGYYFDYAYRLQVDTLGYTAPPADTGGGSKQYDIYVRELASQNIYGVTNPTESEITGGAYLRFKSYIIIDNNYSQDDKNTAGTPVFSTFGYDGLKCTIVHEYFHAIQIGAYGRTNFSAYYEMASTWMEWRAFPEIYDYVLQARRFFTSPQTYYFGREEAEFGYKYGPFALYLTSRFGDNLMRQSWEEVRNGQAPYKALDIACVKNGTTLQGVWCDFLPLLYRTNSRSRKLGLPQELPVAHLYPALKESYTEMYSEPSISISQRIPAYSALFIRNILLPEGTNTPDTADIIFTNPHTDAIIRGSASDASFVYELRSNPGLEQQISGTTYSWSYSIDGAKPCYFSNVSNGYVTDGVDNVFPSPYRLGMDKELYFPAPAQSLVGKEIVLEIFDLSTRVLLHEEATVIRANTLPGKSTLLRVVTWKPDNVLSTGVYLYKLRYFDTITFGKFVIKQ